MVLDEHKEPVPVEEVEREDQDNADTYYEQWHVQKHGVPPEPLTSVGAGTWTRESGGLWLIGKSLEPRVRSPSLSAEVIAPPSFRPFQRHSSRAEEE